MGALILLFCQASITNLSPLLQSRFAGFVCSMYELMDGKTAEVAGLP